MRDEQIVRMKKVLDTIKTENSFLKTKLYEESQSKETLSIGSGHEEDSKEYKILKASAETLKKEISIRDIAFDKLKESQSVALENKDKKIEQLEQRINAVLDSQSKNGENDLAVEMKKIANENRLLQSQIEVKDRTIDNMNRRIEMSKQDGNHKENIELERVKEQNRAALEAMQAFKVEKADLEIKLRGALRDIRQKETEASILKEKDSKPTVDHSVELKSKDKELQTLKIENGKLSDQAKAITIRCKQLEQKMKFLNAQVESANKGRGQMSSNSKSGSSGREAKLALKLKQLETSREKMSMDTQRLSSQLDAKKKEAVVLTTENNLLKNKMAELEQKLNKIERKAS
jgi:chromosome segregation ATPase